MFQDESWKPIYFGINRSNVKVTSHKNCQRGSLHSCECWFLLVLMDSQPHEDFAPVTAQSTVG